MSNSSGTLSHVSEDGDNAGQISPRAIPKPTYRPSDPLRKSHAKKQPIGHISRPRNAFILFRCDFVRQNKVPPRVETNSQSLSKIAGQVWNLMSEQEREPWMEMAKKEKAIHARDNPGYRYARADFVRRKKKKDVERSASPPVHIMTVEVEGEAMLDALQGDSLQLQSPQDVTTRTDLAPNSPLAQLPPVSTLLSTDPPSHRSGSLHSTPSALPEVPCHLVVPSQSHPDPEYLSSSNPYPMTTGHYSFWDPRSKFGGLANLDLNNFSAGDRSSYTPPDVQLLDDSGRREGPDEYADLFPDSDNRALLEFGHGSTSRSSFDSSNTLYGSTRRRCLENNWSNQSTVVYDVVSGEDISPHFTRLTLSTTAGLSHV